MSYPKLVIVSSGEKTAILLDGKMMSEGIENVEFLAEGATTTLNITGIDVERFSFGGPEDFKSFCEAIKE